MSDRTAILVRLDGLKNQFEAEDWWSSKLPEHVGRRTQVKHLIQQLRYRFMARQLSCEFMLHAMDGLQKPLEKKRSEVLGISVGFKRPNVSGVEWIDVHGTCEPSEAVRIAARRPDGLRLLAEGYALHGTSPMVAWKNAHQFLDEDDFVSSAKMAAG
jgi:hypothetical protein